MFTHHELEPEKIYGSWLLPVVRSSRRCPRHSLSRAWPEAVRGDRLGFDYALLGLGAILATIIIVIFYGRLTIHKVPMARS